MLDLLHFTLESPEDIEQAILDDGGCILDSLLSPDLCDELISWLPQQAVTTISTIKDARAHGVNTR